MRSTLLLTMLASVVVLTACKGSNQASTFSPTSKDPLASFQAFFAPCAAALGKETNSVYQNRTGWSQKGESAAEVKYDVKKTDSLVSPYTAFVDFRDIEAIGQAPDEAGARALNIPENATLLTQRHWTIRYAYQDNKWSVQDVAFAFAMPQANLAESAPTPMKFKDLVDSRASAAACAPT